MNAESQLKLLLEIANTVKILGETDKAAGVKILKQGEMVENLNNTNKLIAEALDALFKMIEELRTAINELKNEGGKDELPPFDWSRLPIN